MKHITVESPVSRVAETSSADFVGCALFLVRSVALVIFVLMAMAEPFVAVITGFLALGFFSVSVLFGFIFRAPFPHRWYVLGASVVFLVSYLLYRAVMQGVQRVLG